MGKIAKSLSEVYRTVVIPNNASLVKRMFAFFGPAYLISVGYMDPGNWATDLEGGSRFGYKLMWVLLMSNAMAVVLQVLSARLGIVTGRDLAQACRDNFPRSVTFMLWILAEIAIVACDLAEVLGTVIGLNLLLKIPLMWGVCIAALDTFVFLAIQNFGVRKFESLIMFLITAIGLCFIFEIVKSNPDWSEVITGFVPRLPDGALYVAIGIIGATVMPHNLYLHSALVQSRAYDPSAEGKRQACRFNFLDTALALNFAFIVNAAILIVAAATFFKHGVIVTELQQAHNMLSPLLGTALAGIVFAFALVCAGQASTITGTLAGQIVMEGFLRFKIRPVLRRFITRILAVGPAAFTIAVTGEQGTYSLLILSQVILSLQLPFAVIPLIHFTSDRSTMGEFANNKPTKFLAWIVAIIIVCLNAKLIIDQIHDWVVSVSDPRLIYGTVVPICVALLILLLYVSIKPFVHLPPKETIPAWKKLSHFIRADEDRLDLETPSYKKIGVALAFTDDDRKVLSHALPLARQHDAVLCLFHVVEGAGGSIYGPETYDAEAREDEAYLNKLAVALGHRGVEVEMFLGYGSVPGELIRLSEEQKIDALVMGGHGHRGISDIVFGSTVAPVRHRLNIPVLIVR